MLNGKHPKYYTVGKNVLNLTHFFVSQTVYLNFCINLTQDILEYVRK